jgi:sec-independent protein translocase protein TatA
MTAMLAFGMPGPMEWIIIAALGLLIFGKRLPEVGRSLGRGIVEFKKGLNSVGEDLEQVDVSQPPPARTALPPDTQPQFDPYTGKPLQARFDPYTGKPLDPSARAEASTGASERTG